METETRNSKQERYKTGPKLIETCSHVIEDSCLYGQRKLTMSNQI